jgi:WD40 repeat protein
MNLPWLQQLRQRLGHATPRTQSRSPAVRPQLELLEGRIVPSVNSGGTFDKTLKVWDARTGQETLKGHTDTVSSVAFSPDGKRLLSGSFQTVKVWDAQTGQKTLTLKGHTLGVKSVAFSPDGKRLASASEDKTVKVWDAQTGQEILTLKGHTHFVNSVALSPDGKRLASASVDKTVKVWDAPISQGTLKGHSD